MEHVGSSHSEGTLGGEGLKSTSILGVCVHRGCHEQGYRSQSLPAIIIESDNKKIFVAFAAAQVALRSGWARDGRALHWQSHAELMARSAAGCGGLHRAS